MKSLCSILDQILPHFLPNKCILMAQQFGKPFFGQYKPDDSNRLFLMCEIYCLVHWPEADSGLLAACYD